MSTGTDSDSADLSGASRVHVVAAISAAAVALLGYIAGAGPTFYWLDSAEFVASAWTLGVAHPPGHPLAALAARLACYLPCGTIAFRVGLASALQMSGAVALLTLIGAELFSRHVRAGRTPSRPLLALLAASAGLAPAFSYALWFHAVRAEVYALNLLLLSAAVYLLLRGLRQADPRYLPAAAFVVGLGLCNHHLLVLLALPGLLLLASAYKRRKRALIWVAASALLGLSVLGYLPARSLAAPRVNWGAPHTLERFGWVVSAKAFQQKSADRAAAETVRHRGLGAVFAVMGGPPTSTGPMLVGALIALLGLHGLALLLRARGCRRVGLAMIAMVVAGLLGPMIVGFDPFNPDAHGYLACSVALFGPLAALSLFTLSRVVNARALTVTIALVAVALPSLRAVLNWPRVDLSAHWAADETAREVLDVPQDTLLVTSYFQTIFGLWALRSAEDARPDVTVAHRGFAAQPGYLEGLATRQPGARALLHRWQQDGQLSLSQLVPTLARRPVMLEYDLGLAPSLTASALPAGLLLRLIGLSAPASAVGRRHARRIRDYLRRIDDPHELETRRALVWRHYLLAEFACRRQLAELAQLHLSAALKLAPRSRHLQQLSRRCL